MKNIVYGDIIMIFQRLFLKKPTNESDYLLNEFIYATCNSLSTNLNCVIVIINSTFVVIRVANPLFVLDKMEESRHYSDSFRDILSKQSGPLL